MSAEDVLSNSHGLGLNPLKDASGSAQKQEIGGKAGIGQTHLTHGALAGGQKKTPQAQQKNGLGQEPNIGLNTYQKQTNGETGNRQPINSSLGRHQKPENNVAAGQQDHANNGGLGKETGLGDDKKWLNSKGLPANTVLGYKQQSKGGSSNVLDGSRNAGSGNSENRANNEGIRYGQPANSGLEHGQKKALNGGQGNPLPAYSGLDSGQKKALSGGLLGNSIFDNGQKTARSGGQGYPLLGNSRSDNGQKKALNGGLGYSLPAHSRLGSGQKQSSNGGLGYGLPAKAASEDNGLKRALNGVQSYPQTATSSRGNGLKKSSNGVGQPSNSGFGSYGSGAIVNQQRPLTNALSYGHGQPSYAAQGALGYGHGRPATGVSGYHHQAAGGKTASGYRPSGGYGKSGSAQSGLGVGLGGLGDVLQFGKNAAARLAAAKASAIKAGVGIAKNVVGDVQDGVRKDSRSAVASPGRAPPSVRIASPVWLTAPGKSWRARRRASRRA